MTGHEITNGNVDLFVIETPLEPGVILTPPGAATPLLNVHSPELLPHFDYNTPWTERLPEAVVPYLNNAPAETIAFAEIVYSGVIQRLGIRNTESLHGIDPSLSVPENIGRIVQKAKYGSAEADELVTMMHGLGMQSVELSKVIFDGSVWNPALSHVRNRVLEQSPSMLWETEIVDKPAMIGDVAVARDSEEQDLQAFAVRARLWRGSIDSNTNIRHVISLIARIDENSGFDNWFADKYPARYSQETPFSAVIKQQYDPRNSAQSTIGKNQRLMSAINDFITSDFSELPSWLVPVSSTIYAYNPHQVKSEPKPQPINIEETLKYIADRDAEVDADRIRLHREEFAEYYASLPKEPFIVVEYPQETSTVNSRS